MLINFRMPVITQYDITEAPALRGPRFVTSCCVLTAVDNCKVHSSHGQALCVAAGVPGKYVHITQFLSGDLNSTECYKTHSNMLGFFEVFFIEW